MWLIAPVISVMFESASTQTVQSSQQPVVQEVPDTGALNLNNWLKENIQSLLPKDDPVHTLQWLCVVIFLAFLLKNIFSFIEFYVMTYIEQSVVKDLREQVYERVIYQSMGFFHSHNASLFLR